MVCTKKTEKFPKMAWCRGGALLEPFLLKIWYKLGNRGPLSGALGVQNRPMTAIAYKIHSYGDRKLKIGMNIDVM